MVEEGQYLVVDEVRRRERRLLQVDLGKAHVGVGVDTRLLVDLSHALDVADVVGVLTEKETGVVGLDLTSRKLEPMACVTRHRRFT